MGQPSQPPKRQRKRLRTIVRRREGAARLSFEIDRSALKDDLLIILPILVLVVGAFWFASRYVKPAPPDVFVLSTGAQGGAYHLFGEKYRDILARDGVRVELRSSAGSVENLQRLADPASGVDAALVQGGVASEASANGLLSLGSIGYEPLWIFYRGTPLSLLNELAGKRLAIGAEGSGTRALALQLLRAVGADRSPTSLQAMGATDAAQALSQGTIDAAFIVASADAPIVQRLLNATGVRLLSIANAEAFTRRFPFLSKLTLPRGVIDLNAQLPADEVQLLAATANVVVREDFHPALAHLLLHAAAEVHAPSGILHRHREFPSARESEFVISEEAQRYFKTGPPFLRRYLPFWLANFVERMVVLLVPIFAVLVPAVKLLPVLIQWRVKSRLFRWYGELRFLEDELLNEPDPSRLPDMLERLDVIERGVDCTPVPKANADYTYTLRAHIEVVRNRILRVTQTASRTQPPISV